MVAALGTIIGTGTWFDWLLALRNEATPRLLNGLVANA
jgi:hypothetical protein